MTNLTVSVWEKRLLVEALELMIKFGPGPITKLRRVSDLLSKITIVSPLKPGRIDPEAFRRARERSPELKDLTAPKLNPETKPGKLLARLHVLAEQGSTEGERAAARAAIERISR